MLSHLSQADDDISKIEDESQQATPVKCLAVRGANGTAASHGASPVRMHAIHMYEQPLPEPPKLAAPPAPPAPAAPPAEAAPCTAPHAREVWTRVRPYVVLFFVLVLLLVLAIAIFAIVGVAWQGDWC